MDGNNLPSAESKQSLPQVLQINPKHSLLFKGPSSQAATVTISLTNPASKWVAFKVKTTAPKRYCVRPNGGFIKGGDTVNVSIVYQPGENNDAQERARHKFLVQAIFVENDQVQLDQVWRDSPKDRVMESKIRCVFEDTDAEQGTVLAAPGAGQSADTDNRDSMQTTMAATVPTSTEVRSSVGIGQSELELRRLGEDYRRAQDEIANLRDENRRLREDGVRMRNSIAKVSQQGSGSSMVSASTGSRQDIASGLLTDLTKIHTIVAIVAALLLGVVMSKILS